MGNIFKKPKSVKPAPVAAPQAIAETAPEAGETEARRVRKQMGYEKQVLTGALTPKSTGKKQTLGY
jgi:hypothetical protein